jgi:hypothetical protein
MARFFRRFFRRPRGNTDISPAAPPATRLTHGVEVARFFQRKFFAAWFSFDKSIAAFSVTMYDARHEDGSLLSTNISPH